MNSSTTFWVILGGLNNHESYSDPDVYGPYASQEEALAAGRDTWGIEPDGDEEDGMAWTTTMIEQL